MKNISREFKTYLIGTAIVSAMVGLPGHRLLGQLLQQDSTVLDRQSIELSSHNPSLAGGLGGLGEISKAQGTVWECEADCKFGDSNGVNAFKHEITYTSCASTNAGAGNDGKSQCQGALPENCTYLAVTVKSCKLSNPVVTCDL